MMDRGFIISITASMLLSTATFAQDRMRSSDYDGQDAVEACFAWETGFEFVRCERMPIPGQSGRIGQVYSLTDGTRRTLTIDPRTASSDALDADPLIDNLSVAIDQAVRTRSQDDDTLQSEEVSASSTEDLLEIGDGLGALDASALEVETADEPTANEPPKSQIVAENFVMPSVVAFIPGRAEIMPMATGHLNRIETPFSDPMVRTSADPSALNVEFDQNFVYVSVTQPVTLFIHEKGHPDPAIVVSLVPQLIAPRQVKITLPPSIMTQVKKNGAAQRSSNAAEKKATFTGPKANSSGIRREPSKTAATNTVAHLIQTFAQGRVPRNFKQIALDGYAAASFCKNNSGVRFSFRQGAVVASKDYIIVRGMVTSTRKVTLDERDCAKHPETLAVAFSPRTIVSPEHPTDFFVLIRRPSASIQSARGE